MKIKLDPGAVMPTRAHPYDAGLDLYAPENMKPVVLYPFVSSVTIDTGTHIAIPHHFAGLVKSRSGLMQKGIVTDGTVDPDYTGSIRVTLFNHGTETWTIVPGDRIAQLVIVPCCLPPLEQVDNQEKTDWYYAAKRQEDVRSPICESCDQVMRVCDGMGCYKYREWFVKNWNENICARPGEIPPEPPKREFFQYEHPDMVREGIVFENWPN